MCIVCGYGSVLDSVSDDWCVVVAMVMFYTVCQMCLAHIVAQRVSD